MDRLPAVPVSGEIVLMAAAEVFGVLANQIRHIRGGVSAGDEQVLRARYACAWVVDQLSEGSDFDKAALLGNRTAAWVREAVRRCEMLRAVNLEFTAQTDAMLQAVFAIGRAGLGTKVSGIDALGEARAMVHDPIRRVKDAPVVVMAAIIEEFVDQADILQTVRVWLATRDELSITGDVELAGVERALAATIRDALGLPEERVTLAEHAA